MNHFVQRLKKLNKQLERFTNRNDNQSRGRENSSLKGGDFPAFEQLIELEFNDPL